MSDYIILQWCSFDSTIAKIIDWGTQATVGHVDLVLPDGSLLGAQNEDGLGGKPSGVQIRPANYGDTSGMLNRQRAFIPAPKETVDAAYSWAQSMVGCPYDIKAIEGIALNEDWSTPGHFICSGLLTGLFVEPENPLIPHKLPKPWRIFTPEQNMILASAFTEIVAV